MMITIFFFFFLDKFNTEKREGLVLEKEWGHFTHARAHSHTYTHNKQAIACLIICFGNLFG